MDLAVGRPETDSVAVFEKHWRSLARGNLIPLLGDFFDNADPQSLPWTIITDVAPDTLMVRFFGTAMAALIGRDTTGQDYAQLLAPKARAARLAREWAAANQPCGFHSHVLLSDKSGLIYEMNGIGLPLRRSNGALCLVKYAMPERTQNVSNLESSRVIALERMSWIDIGAGVPAMKLTERESM